MIFSLLPAMNGQEATLEAVLSVREKRQRAQQTLLVGGKSVISFSVLAPGGIKRSPFLDQVFEQGKTILLATFSVWERIELSKLGGKSLLLTTVEPATVVKKKLIELEENHPLGRLWDMDVLTINTRPLSRQDFGFPPRSCLCCTENAKICARERRHSSSELNEVMRRCYLAWKIGQSMTDALHKEADLTPKPGLVDQNNQGSHLDMSLSLLHQSADTLSPFFARCFQKGMDFSSLPASPALLAAVRPIGLDAEKAMFQTTGAINTHKGALFAFGILAAALGRRFAMGEANHWSLLSADIAAISRDLVLELGTGVTAGSRIFQQYGLAGARGEAASGFHTLTQTALPAYQRAYSLTNSPKHAWRFVLLNLFANNQDTNVIARGGLEGLHWLQTTAKQHLQNPQLISDQQRLIAVLSALDQRCTEKNISTGGSADLLALTIWLTLYL